MIRAETIVGDVSGLPDCNRGPASLGWWGAAGLMFIQGTGLVLAIGAYYYLIPHARSGLANPAAPALLWGSLVAGLAIASEVPNAWIKRGAARCDRRAVQSGLLTITAFGVALLVFRMLDLATLDVRWDGSAHGSIVWSLLVLHTLFIAADVISWGVMAALARRTEMTGRRFSAIANSSMHWHFIVWSGVALYAVIDWTPRWM